MPGVIILQGRVTATTADLLQGTRLQTVPAGGVLTIQLQADLNNATNNFVATVQLPNGDTPLNAVSVSGNNPALDGVLDTRTLDQYSFGITQGGHAVITLTETGTAILSYRIVYTPA
jgi:hypothetical protein